MGILWINLPASKQQQHSALAISWAVGYRTTEDWRLLLNCFVKLQDVFFQSYNMIDCSLKHWLPVR